MRKVVKGKSIAGANLLIRRGVEGFLLAIEPVRRGQGGYVIGKVGHDAIEVQCRLDLMLGCPLVRDSTTSRIWGRPRNVLADLAIPRETMTIGETRKRDFCRCWNSREVRSMTVESDRGSVWR